MPVGVGCSLVPSSAAVGADLVTVAERADDARVEIDGDDQRAVGHALVVPEPLAILDRPGDRQDPLDDEGFVVRRRSRRRGCSSGVSGRQRRRRAADAGVAEATLSSLMLSTSFGVSHCEVDESCASSDGPAKSAAASANAMPALRPPIHFNALFISVSMPQASRNASACAAASRFGTRPGQGLTRNSRIPAPEKRTRLLPVRPEQVGDRRAKSAAKGHRHARSGR